MTTTNIGNAFPLEHLDSDIARNSYNYQSILTGLINWNNTNDDIVSIRLTKNTDPWFEDYIIPSKKSTLLVDSFKCDITGSVYGNMFFTDCVLNCVSSSGSKQFITTTFDASVYSTPSNIISLTDASEFIIGDLVRFYTSTGTIPTQISSTLLYHIVNKTGNDIQVSATATGTPITLSNGSGTITAYKFESLLSESETDPSDIVTLRLSVNSLGACDWGVYYTPIIYSYIAGNSYKASNYLIDNSIIYRAIFDTSTSDLITYTNVFRPLIYTWSNGADYYYGDIVIDSTNNAAYIVKSDIIGSVIIPSRDITIFEFHANSWDLGTDYNVGSYVYYNGLFYISTKTIINSSLSPALDVNSWESTLILGVNSVGSVTQSTVIRWIVPTDTSKFYLRNESDITSEPNTDIHIQSSVKTKEPASIYQRNVGLYPTSNYMMWPDNIQNAWVPSTQYGPTDTTIPITKRQSYSASIILDHTRMDTAKTVNFINYDGPDLDQGLCIYLPVEIDVGDDGIAYPEDGFTYEFFFRIWPNPELNGEITRDHIVNKSQIYVYSVLNRDSVINEICENPIAKFSMARTTNFYMFGENVSIPDRPVCYRATIIYSDAEKRWNVLDYYQLPDHIFVGPVGFIDPQSPANLDINNDVIGNINPNASFIGYETAAFPMFQDPFSNTNLTPYRFSSDTDYDTFKNRMI